MISAGGVFGGGRRTEKGAGGGGAGGLLDLERKEELILAKQVRQGTVVIQGGANILRVRSRKINKISCSLSSHAQKYSTVQYCSQSAASSKSLAEEICGIVHWAPFFPGVFLGVGRPFYQSV